MSVSSSIGPASGIDYGKLIEGLMAVEQKPLDKIKTRLDNLDKQNNALLSMSALLTGLKISAINFAGAGVFRASSASTSNASILNATAGIGAPVGSYNFIVQRLAAASQVVTQGFADADTTQIGTAGNLKFEYGRSRMDDVAKLADLNGGAGVSRGSIRITDRTGATAVVDLTRAVDLKDVVSAINSTSGINVAAKIDNDKLVLTDNSAGVGTLSVANVTGATTATDLGLTATAVGNTITGNDINKLRTTTKLDLLNSGNGVRTAGVIDDFSLTGSVGSANISLNGAKTLGDVLTAINAQTGATGLTAALSADGHGITLTDAASGPITVTALNGSLAAFDLGLTATPSGGTLTGDRINSGLTSVLIRDLKGGYQGGADTVPTLGTININAEGIDLSSARTVDDVVRLLNTNTQGVTAAIDTNGGGITLTKSDGSSFTVADGSGNLAAWLNIAGTATAGKISSGDLDPRYVSNNTLLATLNAGAGVRPGKFRITDGNGASQTVEITTADTTVGAVLKKINSAGLAITASINDTGDGLLLKSTGGGLTARIEDLDGSTTAAALNIKGDLTGGQIDGSYEKNVAILATDKLNDIVKKINDAGVGVSATIINDGSPSSPFRISLVSRNSGGSGRLNFDGSALGITGTTMVEGQDAVLLYGNSIATALQATSSSNNFSSLVPSVQLSATGLGAATITVTRDDNKVLESVKGFVEQYNKIWDNITEVTKFDINKPSDRGILFGNATVQQIQQGLGFFVTQVFTGTGQLRNLQGVGLKVKEDGKIELDEDKFKAMLGSNPDDVRALFTTKTTGVGDSLSTLIDKFTSADTGIIFKSTDAIQSQQRQWTTRKDSLTDLIALKRNRLIRQFANLEVSIAKLQQQGTALNSYQAQAAKS